MRLVAILLFAAVAAPPAAPSAHAQSPLVINEILAGPARDWDASGAFSSRDDEWVELKNVSGSSLDLTGYFITDGDSIPRYALSGPLGAGAHLLVFGRTSYDWERATGHPAFGLSLGNSGDQVILWKITGPDTAAVDTYTYRSHEAAADRAIGRSPDGSGGWALFDALNLYSGTLLPAGTGCAPSPGAANACGSTPTQSTSWGRVKTLYRGTTRR
ncbi:MAG: lamin tail domain-containing protein [Candidatus Eisenbacteria bacterium]